MTTPKIGFACKWSEFDSKNRVISVPDLNTRVTTISWLNKQTRGVAEDRLLELVQHNLQATKSLVEKVGNLDERFRMVRLSSDILPAYTHELWRDYYKRADVLALLERGFSEIGTLARSKQVRLSFHPGQFCVLASDNDNIVANSIEEFEYHVNMARWMGYGATWHDHGFKINVHLSGRGGVEKFLQTLGKLTPEARNLITIENDEVSNGLDSVLSVAEHVAIVLDLHHHWVKTGEYIDPSHSDVVRCIESWRGERPTLHFSTSREDILVGHDRCVRPDLAQLIVGGHKKQQLRAHSDFYWNGAVNEWASGFTKDFDIMCESKAKNLASFRFALEIS